MTDNLVSDLLLNADHQLLVIEDYRKAADRIQKLEMLLGLYRDVLIIEVSMDGLRFMGVNRSALKRALKADTARKALEGKDE